jgi:hypothetical protein
VIWQKFSFSSAPRAFSISTFDCVINRHPKTDSFFAGQSPSMTTFTPLGGKERKKKADDFWIRGNDVAQQMNKNFDSSSISKGGICIMRHECGGFLSFVSVLGEILAMTMTFRN